MKKTLIFILALSLVATLPSGKAYAEEFKPGDKAAILVDVNGDKVGEKLEVSSSEPDEEMGLAFDIQITLTNPRGNVLYQSSEIGELDWFSVETTLFEYEDGARREIAVIRTGCSGTGVSVNAFLLYQPPKSDTVMVACDGNEDLYDANGDGVADVFVSRYRMQNLGIIGASSPWLATFTKPSLHDGYRPVDVTFDILGQDALYRQEWIEGVAETSNSIIENEFVETVGEEHLKHLKMFEEALRAGDMEEAQNIYFTAF